MYSIGELYIGGEGLARGYLNQPQLTSERFIANPFYDPEDANSSPRLYRTGDLVRYLPSGELVFLGRVDEQLKIRGFRIEPDEVATQLSALEEVDSALVMGCEVAGSQQLVGYIKPSVPLDDELTEAFLSTVKTSLSERLPDYLLPSVLLVVEQWPLTANGKVDKKALPSPQAGLSSEHYVAPQTPTQHTLVQIWAGLLQREASDISITDNFFALGGHSLLVLKLASDIRKKMQSDLTIKSLFKNSTIVAQSKLLTGKSICFEHDSLLEDLGPQIESQPIVFCIPGMACLPKDFTSLAHELNVAGYSVKSFTHRGLFNGHPWKTIQENAHAFIDEINRLNRMTKDTPIILVGHSYGGVLASEMSKILSANLQPYHTFVLDTFFEQKHNGVSQPDVMSELISTHSESDEIKRNVANLIKHQTNLLNDCKLPDTEFLNISFLYAKNSIQELSKTDPAYLTKVIGNLDYSQINGDHFSMLERENVKPIILTLQKVLDESHMIEYGLNRTGKFGGGFV